MNNALLFFLRLRSWLHEKSFVSILMAYNSVVISIDVLAIREIDFKRVSANSYRILISTSIFFKLRHDVQVSVGEFQSKSSLNK